MIFDEKRISVGKIKKALSKCGCPAEGDPVFVKRRAKVSGAGERYGFVTVTETVAVELPSVTVNVTAVPDEGHVLT